MKKTITLLTILLLTINFTISAQSNKVVKGKIHSNHTFDPSNKINAGSSIQNFSAPYTFSYSTGTYTNLTGSTSLNNGTTWDDPMFNLPIGFNFVFWHNTISSIYIDGSLNLGGGLIQNTASTGIVPFILYSCDLVDRASHSGAWEGGTGSLSNISYLTSGTVGNRICKVEWNNAGFYDDISTNNSSTDYINMQIWLYEGSNDIEVRFGPSSIPHDSLIYWGLPGPGVGIGIYDMDQDTVDLISLHGISSAPTSVLIDSLVTVTGSPANGMIYRFSWTNTAVHEYDQNQLANIFPNPITSLVTIEWKTPSLSKNTKAQVMDILGNTIYSNLPFDTNGQIKLDCNNLNTGTYIIKLESEDIIAYKKFIKQ